MSEQQVKQAIEAALRNFPGQPLARAATHLLAELGYQSKKDARAEGQHARDLSCDLRSWPRA